MTLVTITISKYSKGSFNTYVDKMRGVKKWQNSVHVVNECHLTISYSTFLPIKPGPIPSFSMRK